MSVVEQTRTVNSHAGVGAGRYRKPWRIKEWLSSQGLYQKDIAARLGIPAETVSRTVLGRANNRKVLRLLKELGCPASYLSLPDDLAGAKQGAK